MGLFSRQAELPTTSYGYTPPRGATAHGWICANRACGGAQWEQVRRWPKICPECSSSTDPNFDEPWAHEAEGVELRYRSASGGYGSGYHADRLIVWRYKDALQRGDLATAADALSDGQARIAERLAESSLYTADRISMPIVSLALEHGLVDQAGSQIVFWSKALVTEDLESDGDRRANVRNFLSAEINFLSTPGGAAHHLAPRMRDHARYLASKAHDVLTADNVTGLRRLQLH
jgi:hypothetical protein